MALNSSGAISLGGSTSGESINLENAQPATATVSLNDAAVRGLAGPSFATPGTVIVMPTDFYGKSNMFTFTLAAGTDVNLRSAAITAGWPGSGAVQATIAPGTTIQSSSTGSYALTINGSWPAGVTLINNGTIEGRGGNGGPGGNSYADPAPQNGTTGGAGGTALLVSVPVTINNASGVIAGGGGGGGGGGGQLSPARSRSGGGGGGGGIGVSSGGTGGLASVAPSGSTAGAPGGAGTLTTFGSGGLGGATASIFRGGNGGPGGSYGSAGVAASGGSGAATNASGGAAGNALSGNSFITFPSLGTIYGARV